MPFRLLPARNICFAYSVILIPAITASSFAAPTSLGVQVGERNISVSERIAEHRRPAISFGISMPRSRNIVVRIVAVQPTGSPRKKTGCSVSTVPIR